MDFIQKFNTSRQNYDNGNTRIGEKDRLWYDSNSNTIRISDGVTPGGIVVSAGSGGGSLNFGTIDSFNNIGSTFNNITVLRFDSSAGFTLTDLGGGALKVSATGLFGNIDGGLSDSSYGGIPNIDGGGI